MPAAYLYPSIASGYGIANKTNIGRFSYTGQTWLPDLGMYYYKARIYSPTLGRFLQTDPIGYGDGVNIYVYVQGDPINYTDPYGLNAEGVDDCPPKECIEVNGEPEPKVTINIGPLLGIGGGFVLPSPNPFGGGGGGSANSLEEINEKKCDGLPGFEQFEEAAQIAILSYPVNDYTPPWLRGIFIHNHFKETVRSFANTSVDVSYINGTVASWWDLGSVRPDAIYGNRRNPDFIIELKTSNARLRNPQLSNYFKNLPPNTRICEIYENSN